MSLGKIFSSIRFIFILVVALIASFTAIIYSTNYLTEEQHIVNNIQNEILEETGNIKQEYTYLMNIIDTKSEVEVNWNALDEVPGNDQFLILIYNEDSLIYWNNNTLSDDFLNIEIDHFSIISEHSGWYLIFSKIINNNKILIARLLKSKYNAENDITNTISMGMVRCNSLKFTIEPNKSEYLITDSNGNYLVGLYFVDDSYLSPQANTMLFVIFLLIYIFLLVLISRIYELLSHRFKHKFLFFFLLVIDIVILRFLEYSFHFPSVVKQTNIFFEKFDLFIAFNSTGDLLINSLIFLFVAIYFFRNFNLDPFQENKKGKYFSYLFYLGVSIASLFIFYLIYQVILQLPYNSFYGFAIEAGITIYSLIALLIFILGLFVINHSVSRYLTNIHFPVYFLIIWSIILLLSAHYVLNIQWVICQIAIAFFLFISFAYYYLSKNKRQSFYKYLMLLLIYTISTTYVVNRGRIAKKDIHQMKTLSVLSDPHDSILETSYLDFEKKITEDATVKNILLDNSTNYKTNLEDYLKKKYFSLLNEKYDIQITICKDDEKLEIKPEDFIVDCSAYFDGFINDEHNERITDNLYLISGDPESIYYMGKTSFMITGAPINIYIEFFFTYVPEGLGYPELLLNKSVFNIDLSDYSFAQYNNGQLVNKFGDYRYLTYMNQNKANTDDELYDLNNYRHVKHKLSDNNYLVISRPKDRIAVHLVTFAVLFVFFLVILFVVVLILFGKEAKNLIRLSFQSRIQMIFTSTISLIIVLLATITLFYANIDDRNRLVYQLNEKTNSVIIELQHKLSENDNFFEIDQEELEYLLRKFSMVFFSDINIYSPSGELISTSRPELFDQGFLAARINPKAYEELFIKDQLFYVHQEKIGKTSYYSSYAPVVLRGSQTAGVINLPYFAKQSEVNKSYYLMIITFIDLFVILGIVGTIIAIILSRLITNPLTVLQKKLTEIQIDKRNEIIEWKTKDEIGQLIEAYNDMIEKLEASTELLKQSERESAWREVAQQIAHEIKNPLTPMKLNIQYLEKAFNEKDPDLDEKVKNISELLISQIDTLNKVAEMFADFSKTKARKFDKVDLLKTINESILLYKNHSNIIFEINSENNIQYYTKANEKDLVRMFNNLIKNAIHSTESRDSGLIRIGVSAGDDFHEIKFSDNGKGIPDQAKANIFKPYFTTKSKGTGLGLAIVKNIMTEIGGEITFESKVGIGTTFKLKFPVFKK